MTGVLCTVYGARVYLQELLPFAQIKFSRLFSAVFWDIDIKIGIWIGLY